MTTTLIANPKGNYRAKDIRDMLAEKGWNVYGYYVKAIGRKYRILAVKTVKGVVRVELGDGSWANASDFEGFEVA